MLQPLHTAVYLWGRILHLEYAFGGITNYCPELLVESVGRLIDNFNYEPA